jgi:hypothetical protein
MVGLLKEVVAICAQDGLCGCAYSRSRPSGAGGGQVGTSRAEEYGEWDGIWAIGSNFDMESSPPIPKVIHVALAVEGDDGDDEEDDLLRFNHVDQKPRPYALRRSSEGLDDKKNYDRGSSGSVSSSLSASTGTGHAQILSSWSDGAARPATTTAFVLPAHKPNEQRQRPLPPKLAGISDLDGSSCCSSRDGNGAEEEECGFFWFGAKSSISESSSSANLRCRRRPARRAAPFKGSRRSLPLSKRYDNYLPATATAPTEASSLASF